MKPFSLSVSGALLSVILAAPALADDTRQASVAPVPSFVEEASAAGIEHSYDGAWEFFVGGGTAIFDCDGDRKPDLFFAGGKNPAQLFRNESRVAGPLKFTAVETGLNEKQATGVLGAYPLDINNDDILISSCCAWVKT